MKKQKRHLKVASGLFISKDVLKRANIVDIDDIELELADQEIRIRPKKKKSWKILNSDSPLWDCVGFAEAEGINGRDHDEYIYDNSLPEKFTK